MSLDNLDVSHYKLSMSAKDGPWVIGMTDEADVRPVVPLWLPAHPRLLAASRTPTHQRGWHRISEERLPKRVFDVARPRIR